MTELWFIGGALLGVPLGVLLGHLAWIWWDTNRCRFGSHSEALLRLVNDMECQYRCVNCGHTRIGPRPTVGL